MTNFRNIAIATLLILGMQSCGNTAEDSLIVSVEGGKLQGVASDTQGVYVYKCVPFAAPPVGDLRWKAPQPVVAWEGVKVADTFGNAAMQASHVEGDFYQKEFFFNGDAPYSEDCLFLNVWTNAPGKTDEKLPVAFWVHGGAYMSGWGFEPEMDGEAWAERGVVLVTINYRLGVFGFLAHPELSAEDPNHSSGNYGMLDQIAALKWVKNNIAQFGGDPNNIMIFGQSAGAASIKTLVTSPLSKDIPAKAVIMSGGGVSEFSLMGNAPLANAEVKGKDLMDWAGYDTLEKMRAASAQDVYDMVGKYGAEKKTWVSFGPNIDGHALRQSFDKAAMAGEISDVPYMIGSTKEDIGPLAGKESLGKFCALREEAGKPAYAYQFARELPGDESGAFHSSELWYIFHTLQRSWRPFTPADYDLSRVMVDAWSNFAKHANPNGKSEGAWKAYTKTEPNYMLFKLAGEKESSEMGQPLPSKQVNSPF